MRELGLARARLLLGDLALGDVLRGAVHPHHVLVRIPLRPAALADPADVAALGDDAELAGVLLAGDQALHARQRDRTILGVDQREAAAARLALLHLLAREAGDARERAGHPLHRDAPVALDADRVRVVRGELGDRPVARLRFLQAPARRDRARSCRAARARIRAASRRASRSALSTDRAQKRRPSRATRHACVSTRPSRAAVARSAAGLPASASSVG